MNTKTPDHVLRAVADAYCAEDKPTMKDLASRFRIGLKSVRSALYTHLTEDQRKSEAALRYSRTKLGALNPMTGKYGALHHNFVGAASDHKGYLTVLRPPFMTQGTSKRVFQHHAVMCEALGLSGIPEGFHVHHINGDKTDNRLENLCLASASGHVALHRSTPRSEELTLWELYQFSIWKSKRTPAS